MIKVGSKLYIIDNCGGGKVLCIKLLKKSSFGSASVGDLILVTVKSYGKVIKNRRIVKKSVYIGLIVCVKKEINGKNGITLKTLENNVVLLNKDLMLIGKGIRGSVFSELRKKGFSRIATIAENVV